MKGIPERWDSYYNHGERIPRTPFISFKTPLSKKFFRHSTRKRSLIRDTKYAWTPEILENTIPGLGAVIDLTATTRYYNHREFKYVKHFKITVPGRVVPPENKIEKFFSYVDEVRESMPNKLIGVHCTHGVNRTGYFVCRYLIDKMGWPVDKAISEVGQSRGYEIERDCFLNDLRHSTKESRSVHKLPTEQNKEMKRNAHDQKKK